MSKNVISYLYSCNSSVLTVVTFKYEILETCVNITLLCTVSITLIYVIPMRVFVSYNNIIKYFSHIIGFSPRLFMVWYAINVGFNGSIIIADVNNCLCVSIHAYVYAHVCSVFNLCYYIGSAGNGLNVLNRWPK